jgi:hypothetical protein
LEDFKTKDSFLKDKKIVLGLSGGIDSVVLLHYLHKHYPNNLRAVHCNHHLSKHCSEWEVFCKDLCAALNIPYTNIDIKLLKVSNIEENARKIRYHSLSCNLENSSKALNYRLYKQIFEFENYFNILENKDIFTFCKFRTTNTKLPIETGRWNNIARENRKCQLCQENQIGDEFHYIMRCSYFHDKRESCIEKRYLTRINVLKFKNKNKQSLFS